ncbi:carbohydrate ABC transporter permease [Pseudonocardia sp. MH-G8]|uniref:carbohydrate ABC transporter permease n=1 Tax=Pseudonocardia sp. MH-G8 TaxID=1854588 RepID=UPI00130412F6|nr:sugar ABC transporter permease [Pseudonocardia sp. MH-G8]
MTSAGSAAPVRPTQTSERARRNRRRTGVGLALPAVLVMAGLTVVPILSVLQRAISGDGVAAFGRLFDSPDFVQVLANTLVWTVVSVVGALVLGHGAALLMNSRYLRAAGLWRGLFMIPWIIPNVVGATVWKWNFSIDYGLVNHTLLQAGLLSEPIGWLSDPNVVLYALAVVQVWFTAPFIMLMVSAALTSIPDERIEAARIDGAGGLAVLRHIVLPAIRPTTGLSALLMVVWALNSFTIIWVATGGGPAGSSTILPILIYQAFQNGDAAMVSAVAVIQLAVSMVFAVIYVRAMRGEEETA